MRRRDLRALAGVCDGLLHRRARLPVVEGACRHARRGIRRPADAGLRGGAGREEARDLVIEPGMVFTLEPRILVKNARPSAQYGDPVLVTDTGARRLGRRRLGPA